MPNQQQLDLLKQGVDAWNAWRQANPVTEPDLNDADLSKATLIGANLIGADLSEANLSDANLQGAFLREANLRGALITPEQLNQTQSPDNFPQKCSLSGEQIKCRGNHVLCRNISNKRSTVLTRCATAVNATDRTLNTPGNDRAMVHSGGQARRKQVETYIDADGCRPNCRGQVKGARVIRKGGTATTRSTGPGLPCRKVACHFLASSTISACG